MAASWVDIANSALVKCGAATIVSLTDASREANIVNLRLFYARDTVLRMHAWKDATNRVILSPLVTAPAFGYDYQFQLPSDCLRVLQVVSDNTYKIERDMVLTDDSIVNLIYVSRVQDPTTLDSLLSDLIASYLAKDIIYSLTQDSQMTAMMAKDFETELRLAKNIDSKSQSREQIQMTWLTDLRLSGSSSGSAPLGYPLAPGAPPIS